MPGAFFMDKCISMWRDDLISNLPTNNVKGNLQHIQDATAT